MSCRGIDGLFDGQELVVVLAGFFVASTHECVDGIWGEAEHAEAADVRDDMDIAQLTVFHSLCTCAVGDQPEKHLGQRLQIVDCDILSRSNFNTNDDISAHVTKHIGGEVVHQTAINEYFVTNRDRREYAWNGHTGPHGCRHATTTQHHFLAGNHVGCHAGKWNGQVVKVHFLLISDT